MKIRVWVSIIDTKTGIEKTNRMYEFSAFRKATTIRRAIQNARIAEMNDAIERITNTYGIPYYAVYRMAMDGIINPIANLQFKADIME